MHDRPGIWLRIFTILTSLAIIAAAPVKPPIPISYATTRITGPLTKNGLVDYVAAFNQHFGKGVTPENNAAVPLLILFRPGSFRGWQSKLFKGKMVTTSIPGWGAMRRKALGITAHDLTGPRFIDFQTFRKHADPAAVSQAAGDTGHLSPAPRYIPGKLYIHPWSAHNHPWVAAWLQVNEGALDIAQAAFYRPRFFNPLLRNLRSEPMANAIGSAWGIFGEIQTASEYLVVRAMLELHRNDIESCENDLLSANHAGILLSQEHMLMSSMAACAAASFPAQADEALANSGKLSTRQDLAYLHKLQMLGTMAPISNVLDTTERWWILSAFQSAAVTNNLAILPIPIVKNRWSQSSYANAMIIVNHFQDRLVNTFKIHSLIGRLIALKKDEAFWRHKSSNPIIVYLVKNLLKDEPLIINNTSNLAARSRMDYLVFALAAYRSDHGIFPDRLAQLSPKYLRAIPRDPFTGKPFQYSTGPTGCTIASPGRFPKRLEVTGKHFHYLPMVVHLSKVGARGSRTDQNEMLH